MFKKLIGLGLVIGVVFVAGCAQTTETATIVAPSVPTGLRADSSVDSTIDLIWQSTSEADIAGYNVYRSTTSGSGYSKIATVKMGRAFWDTGTTITTTDSSTWVPHVAGTGVIFYPMPCDLSTREGTIMYTLTQAADADLVIYDVLGNIVWNRSYLIGVAGGTAGVNKIPWDGTDNDGQILPDGIYPLKVSYISTSEGDYALVWDGNRGLTTGPTYYYVITAFNTLEVESEYSNEASAEASADGVTHWPVGVKLGTEDDPVFEYIKTPSSYR